jgi:hypothetical protein
MRVVYGEAEYSLILTRYLSIRRDISVFLSKPFDLHFGAGGQCAISNTGTVLVDGDDTSITYSEFFSLSKKRPTRREKEAGFLKFLHPEDKDSEYGEKDKDVVVCLFFSEHHHTSGYPAYFAEGPVLQMLNIDWEDVITLGYEGNENLLRYIVFVIRNNHHTNGILGGEEFLHNVDGSLLLKH